uniref:Uncharacterized protein n=1 Tax=Sorangium cellulosum TaxID=56 RepID=A0A3S7V050_SORCE|nr:hypothetical protein [Sorangium cellulosum]
MSERPVHPRPRRLADWINPTDAKKVHSLIDKVYKRKNLEIAWKRVQANRGSGGVDGESVRALPVLRGAHKLPGIAAVSGTRARKLAPPASAEEPARALDPTATNGFRAAVPPPAAPHPPSLAVSTASQSADPRWEPGAGNPLAGFCPGGGPDGPKVGQSWAVPTGTRGRQERSEERARRGVGSPCPLRHRRRARSAPSSRPWLPRSHLRGSALRRTILAPHSVRPASDHLVGQARMDLVVDGQLVVELKATECIAPIHVAQLLHISRQQDYGLAS